ncbi:hypothetical protein [Vibrio sp. 10N.261.51.F12]|uniref:hypothetical protein n=1 Tax=Vibrio sp. 10N.261.51.F12 TaxID=3229679 RepID=UPI0035515B88
MKHQKSRQELRQKSQLTAQEVREAFVTLSVARERRDYKKFDTPVRERVVYTV